MATPQTIGIIGLGLVGQALASRLLSAGHPVVGFDLRAEARAALSSSGGKALDAAVEVGAAAERVLLAVFDTGDVIDVLEGAGGLLVPNARVRTVIDCSTGDPQQLRALAGRLQSRGIGFIEGPLSGSSQQIAAGEATQLLGGDEATLQACADLLEAIAPRRIHVGAAGMAASAKLATNLVLGLNRAALAEGFVFADTLGIPPDTFLALVLATPARSAAAESKGALMARGEFTPQSRIRQHLKDVDLMLESAATSGQELPLSQAHAALLRSAIAAGDGDLDNAAIIRELRRRRVAR